MKSQMKAILKRMPFVQKYVYSKKHITSNKTKYVYRKRNKAYQIADLLGRIDIKIDKETLFQHWIDENIAFINIHSVMGNMPPNYQKVLTHSLNELIKMEEHPDILVILNAVKKYVFRIIDEIRHSEMPAEIKSETSALFENMIIQKARTLEDALQRILLWSSIFWQTGHTLVGLGRLDLILAEYEKSYDEATCIDRIVEFLQKLHEYYNFKSASLKGDIGQIIILGGLNEEGKYFSNKMTSNFISAVEQCSITDPKILLRVSSCMPDELLEKALTCIATGCGSPLLSNDDVVIPTLTKLGYASDAYNYVTSACWEPLCYGKSFDQNNVSGINFAQVLSDTITDQVLLTSESFESVIMLYKKHLENSIDQILFYIDQIQWEEEPLYSFFDEQCSKSGRDISKGGAKYNNFGILSIGLSNAIDSLCNISRLVFQEKRITLQQVYLYGKNDLETVSAIQHELESASFGHDSEEVIALTNRLISFVTHKLCDYQNHLGGKVKFGLSSPQYVEAGRRTAQTFDKRKIHEPLGVHISANDCCAYTELIDFASALNYSSLSSNGNVIDFIVSPGMLKDNMEKFKSLIKAGIKKGFFQMQLNVTSSQILIEAKQNPEKFPNLIVRVWGFSAYFKDLPDEYKDVLIHRVLMSEGLENE